MYGMYCRRFLATEQNRTIDHFALIGKMNDTRHTVTSETERRTHREKRDTRSLVVTGSAPLVPYVHVDRYASRKKLPKKK